MTSNSHSNRHTKMPVNSQTSTASERNEVHRQLLSGELVTGELTPLFISDHWQVGLWLPNGPPATM